ncbi:MAG: hypothetical protein HN742_31255 [Lentisphaerae bacterium]|nr:hypothetical protein [Lentisphaerota bacterium]MBT4822290.1 hypothetical protein [Lentisphaerota bacterium]MBT5612018.1 hypothetical protein [Lentisphaerota bacterium]MBT7054766.1 hypothetical protein [Lentisphaerota bacterium]MBT7846389.1 hypothetical protein [Lentisphaerota bacterium]
MMKSKTLVALGLLMTDLSAFVLTVVLLPRRGSFRFSGPLSHFINSRGRWDIAWGVLIAAVILSGGVLVLLEGFGVFGKETRGVGESAVRPEE